MSKSKALLATICMALGAGALIGAVTFEGAPRAAARRDDQASAGDAERKPRPPAPAPAPAPKPKAGTMPATTAAAAASPEVPMAARPSLSVPNFKGKLLSVARREGRKLGLVVNARDDEGQRVPVEEAPNYRVKRQLTEAGTSVEPGTAVELRVREIEAPSGY
jgi:hypothetical protein